MYNKSANNPHRQGVMKGRRDKTVKTKDSKVIENAYDKALSNLDRLGENISKHIQPSQKDAATVKELIADYRRQSKTLEDHKNELDPKQKEKLLSIRSKHENTIEGIRVQLPKLIAAQKAEDEKNAKGLNAQRQQEANAKARCDELVQQLNTLAKQYIDASLDTADELLTQYTKVKGQLQKSASELPIGNSDAEGKRLYTVTSLKASDKRVEIGTALKEIRVLADEHSKASDRTRKSVLSSFRKQKTQLFKDLQRELPKESSELAELRNKITTIDKEVRECDEAADKLKREKDAALKKIFEENKRKMEERTKAAGLVGALLHIAPKDVQDGLNYLVSNPAIVNALAHNQDVIRALDGTSLQEGFKQITAGVVDGTVANAVDGELTQINPLSAGNQLAVIDAAIKTLTAQSDSTPESKKAIEALRFIRRTVVGMQRLANGDVSHLSFIFLSKDGKSLFVTQFGVADGINNLESWIHLANSLAGADAGEMLLEFSNPQQAAFLSMLAQYDFLKTTQNARKALEQVYTHGALTQGSQTNALTQVFSSALAQIGGGTLPQINSLDGVVDLVLLAAGNSKAMAGLFGANALEIQKRLDLINKQFAGQTNVAVSPEQMITLVEGVGALLTTLNQIPKLETGPIAEYYKSHLNPNRLPDGGVVVTVVDQSLATNPVALNLLAGGDGTVKPVDEVTPVLTLTNSVVSEDEKQLQQKREQELRLQKKQQADEQRKQRQEEHLNKLIEALVDQKAKFNSVLGQLGVVISELFDKADDDDNYRTVAHTALNLHDKLVRASAYFDAPTLEGFPAFQQYCRDSIAEAAKEFDQHRGIWHASFPLIIKGFLGVLVGVLATVTVVSLPFLIAGREGYVSTFFKTPETASSKRLSEINSNLQAIETEIKEQMESDVFHMETPTLVSVHAG